MAKAKEKTAKKKKTYNHKYYPARVYLGSGSIQVTFRKADEERHAEEEMLTTLKEIKKTTKRSISFIIRRILEKKFNLKGTKLLAKVEKRAAKIGVGAARVVKDILGDSFKNSTADEISEEIRGFKNTE